MDCKDGMDSMDGDDRGGGWENFNVFFCRLMCLCTRHPKGVEGKGMRAELVIAGTYDGNVAFSGRDRTERGIRSWEIPMCFFVD